MPTTIAELMSKIPAILARQTTSVPDLLAQFTFTGREAGNWVVEVKNGAASVTQGTCPSPQVTLEADSDDCLKILSGELDALQAFLSGRIRAWGDVALMVKIVQLLRS
jgi:putative sterol carrier protein